ncbi:hypothetical protein EAI_06972, partial [Harpegnathos saltator]
LMVGWYRSRVRVLEERPFQCYKCLRFGHMAVVCQSEIGLGGHCFRVDHVARGCTAEVRCLVCQNQGSESD